MGSGKGRQEVHPSFSLFALPPRGWGPASRGWSATLAEKLARPAPEAPRIRLSGRTGGGARAREPPPGRRGRSPWVLTPPPLLPAVLAAAASVVSMPGLGSAGAWDAQSGAAGGGGLGVGIAVGRIRVGTALGLGAREAGAARRGLARCGCPAPVRAVGPDRVLRRPSLAGGTGAGASAPAALPLLRTGKPARCCQLTQDHPAALA
ncbi:uncharacterized protein LOC120225964 [Hyaena hyaena]|uniref:uncharacterized protein LOC120225964 n=1 Tax=Hyaena hyaena TaxID=95912 RepID=UPI0019250249|nr:uncharacterized protein LOC120225964 [Hyaena hyaena]